MPAFWRSIGDSRRSVGHIREGGGTFDSRYILGRRTIFLSEDDVEDKLPVDICTYSVRSSHKLVLVGDNLKQRPNRPIRDILRKPRKRLGIRSFIPLA